MNQRALLFIFGIIVSLPVIAQTPATRLVTQPIDTTKLVPLHGSVHPLAQARYDHGMVNESAPAERLLMLLNRPPEREASFQQFLKGLYMPGSSSYHHWLTPKEIGIRFGPDDSDIDTVRTWLSNSGFQVNRVSEANRFVEFSGTIGQINAAFHTQIHEYMVGGTLHHANATELRIPQALAGIVARLSPLHDFRPAPQLQVAGKGKYDAGAHQFLPQYNLPSSFNPLLYGVAPGDFYTEYNLNSLYTANVTGAGVTIGIIDESNINVGLANAYRNVFGLKANPVQVILDGGDPGSNSSETESYLDVELAGAAAPGATVNLYLSAGSPYQDPLMLAALRAVEDNRADVLSISWGGGEALLGNNGNQFWNALWEEAAAQGQTVLVSAGDFGQIPDQHYLFSGLLFGPAVNGLASTPWNIAVGGTDFYYTDYASGAPSASTFWNNANDPTTKGSLKAPIAEQVWNDPFGLNAISDGLQRNEIYAGGGGASNCAVLDSSGKCKSGYAKPGWQSGPGVPADGVRDLPDVSLFASNGANYSGYVICDYEGACAPDGSGNFGVDVVGGTSASTPVMAGIMALVVQKYGRQGQANTVLYPLAQQKPAAFHDITLGGNWDICVQGDANCTLNVAGLGANAGKSTVFSAGPGYDQASGLGSVDATQLVNNWNSITFSPTTTTLQIAPNAIVHGTKATLTANVTPSSGSGTPTGAVSVLTNSSLPSSESQTAITLSNGSGSTSLDYLPGGSYQLTARYGGDGVFAGSTSQPQTITVSPEKSTLNLTISGKGTLGSGYGVPLIFSAQPVGVNAPNGSTDGAATGSIAFALDGTTTTVPLNVGGIASWTAPTLAVGSHTVSASYTGDASFQASSAQTQTFNISKGMPWINLEPSFAIGNDGMGDPIYTSSNISVSVQVGPYYGPIFSNTGPAMPGTAVPTGTTTIKIVTAGSDLFGIGCAADNTGYAQTINLVPSQGLFGQYSAATAIFSNLAEGWYYLCAQYNGDTNWASHGLVIANIFSVTTPTTPPATPATTLTITPSSISPGQKAILTATVTGPAGATVAPTGYVTFFDNGAATNWLYLNQLIPSSSGASASFSLPLQSESFWSSGTNQITAVYSGDGNYLSSTSNAVTINVDQGGSDFTLTAQSLQISVASGNVGTDGLNLASMNNFSGSVALTCTPSSSQFSCAVNPTSTALNGTISATLTITAIRPSSSTNIATEHRLKHAGRLGGGVALAFCIFVVLPQPKRRWIGWFCLTVLLGSLCLTACGGGGSSGGGGGTRTPPANGTPAGTYTVVITATSNNIVHNSVINVVVR